MLEKRSPRTVPLAARHPQRFPNVGFGAASQAEPSQMDRVRITRRLLHMLGGAGSCLGKGRGGGYKSICPPPSAGFVEQANERRLLQGLKPSDTSEGLL